MPNPVMQSPAQRYGVLLALNLAAALAMLLLALNQPWLGLRLAAEPGEGDGPGKVRIVVATGPAAGLPVGGELVALGQPGATPLALRADDLLEEPDVVPGYAEYNAFLARQDRLANLLALPQVAAHWRDTAGASGQTTLRPAARPLTSLPREFWFQMLVALAGCLLAGWVWVLKPADWGTRMFAITGLSFPLFALPAAVYSSRELALAGTLFRGLAALNHLGAALFGAALVGIFLAHPRLLVRPLHLAWPFVLFGLWYLSDLTQLAPDLDWGSRFLVMSEMAGAILLGALQWRGARGDPRDRAALRWLILSILTGSGLFILTAVVPVSLGWLPPLPQAYAFGFFLFIYLGIALGLRRYRLFELDQWAYRMLLWVGGALLVIGLDALFILGLELAEAPALGLSLWLTGALYFPLRQWLWTRLARQRRRRMPEMLADVVAIAFAPSLGARERRWDQLLRDLYDPLELNTPAAPAVTMPTIGEDGLTLLVPACGGIGPRRLRHPYRGRRLFAPRDRTFLAALVELMNQAGAGRDAYEQGARGERQRIAQDLHDDIGARLLMLIQRAPDADAAELARGAMSDLRTALATLDARPVPLADAVADWRAEAGQRCEAAGLELDWEADAVAPERLLGASAKAVLERCLRECLTNALKHAHARHFRVRLTWPADAMQLLVRNDGVGTPAASWTPGRGLSGMRARLERDGGTLVLRGGDDGTIEIEARLPLEGGGA